MHYEARYCHLGPMLFSAFRNLAGLHYPGSGHPGPISRVGCIEGHNAVDDIYNPVNLTVHFYIDTTAVVQEGGYQSGDWACASCGPDGCGNGV